MKVTPPTMGDQLKLSRGLLMNACLLLCDGGVTPSALQAWTREIVIHKTLSWRRGSPSVQELVCLSEHKRLLLRGFGKRKPE